MQSDPRVLSVEEAARAVFNTDQPTAQQVSRVREMIHRGVLPASAQGRWTTTADAVAHYLARQALLRGDRSRAENADGEDAKAGGASAVARRVLDAPPVRRSTASDRDYRALYVELMRDYFLATILRRKVVGRSETFHRAVLLGQVVFIALVASLCLAAVRAALAPRPAGQEAVERYLDEHMDDYRVETWFPAEPRPDGSLRIRVQYRYRQRGSNKWVHTDRLFHVVGDRVVLEEQVE
jgi:hypothetical protein